MDAAKTFVLIETFSNDVDNWALCDTIGMQSIQLVRLKYAKEIFSLAEKLINSDNVWKRRLALVLVEYYTRDKTYYPQINVLIKIAENDKEYYVKKAIEWLKRNMQKGK